MLNQGRDTSLPIGHTMHYAVIDLGYGDAGKGIVVARLCATRDVSWVVRHSGGCQAAHNVVTDDGRHHTFAQFGSGTFSGANTFLSKHMMVEPFALINEAVHLAELGVSEPLSRVLIEGDAIVTTPYHWLLNRWMEEERGDARHGSTGRGIGMTQLHAIETSEPLRAWELDSVPRVSEKLDGIRAWALSKGMPEIKLPVLGKVIGKYDDLRNYDLQTTDGDEWASNIGEDETIVFEGSQGVLLDEDYGFHPHTTWTHTNDRNVKTILDDCWRQGYDLGKLTTIGVTRSYMTRHGAGPLVGETTMSAAPEFQPNAWTPSPYPTDLHNGTGRYQGHWRNGHPDAVALNYAVSCMEQIDGLVVTHTDVYPVTAISGYHHNGTPMKLEKLPVDAFEERQKQTEALWDVDWYYQTIPGNGAAEWISEAVGVPLVGKGWGPKISEGVLGV